MLDSGTDWVGKGTEPPKSHVWAQGFVLKDGAGASLVAQWLRICLPVQGTWVWALVLEDSACCGATKPLCHNYWACSLWSLCSATREATAIRSLCTMKSSPHSLQLEKACLQPRRLIYKLINYKKCRKSEKLQEKFTNYSAVEQLKIPSAQYKWVKVIFWETKRKKIRNYSVSETRNFVSWNSIYELSSSIIDTRL